MIVQYIRTNSFIHRMDPLSKIACLFIISTLVFFLNNGAVYLGLYVALSLAAMVLGGVSPRTYLGTAWIFVLAGSGLFLFHVFGNHTGRVIYTLGFLDIYDGGLAMGIYKFFTMVIIALSSLVFVWTTNPRRLVVALVHVGLPYRYAWAFFLSLRFIPLFQVELGVVRDAQAVRGFREGSGMAGKLEMYKRYLVPVLVSATRKSSSVAVAMDCRGFGAYPTRTFVDGFKWSISGITTAILLALWLIYSVIVSVRS